jgi:hypothetical protein
MLLCGCTPYLYNGKTYYSEGEAVAAQRERHAQALADIQPTDHPVGGVLRMYFVDRDTAAKVLTELAGDVPDAMANYVLNATYAKVQFTRDAIAKRKIFDRVELEYWDGEHHDPEPDAYVLYYYPSLTHASWYFIGRQVPPRTPVRFDDAQSDLAKRTIFFLDTLETLARAESKRR